MDAHGVIVRERSILGSHFITRRIWIVVFSAVSGFYIMVSFALLEGAHILRAGVSTLV